MKINSFASPLKACAFLVLAIFSFNAQAEYYYVESGPYESSPKCVSVKRHYCSRHYYSCQPRYKRVRYYYPVVKYYVPACGGCYNDYYSCSSCSSCCGSYYVTYPVRYAYVCNDCQDNMWVPGYMCHGRWVSGHWR